MKKLLLILFCLPMIGFGQTDRTGNDFFELYKGDYCYWKINEMKKSRNVLQILINSQNQFLIEGTLIELKDIKSIVHRFLTNKGRDASWPDNIEEALIGIQSNGYKTLDYEIIRIIYNTYDELNIPIDDRKLCYTTTQSGIFKTPSKYPPPPPPPKVIEIVEDDEVIEVEIEIAVTESDENEEIEISEEYDDEIFQVVEDDPNFKCMNFRKKEYCGYAALTRFLQENVKYPAIAREYNIEGRVFVHFVVEKDGSVTNVKLARGVDKNLDAEAIRVVKSFPNWNPGRQRGKAVRVSYTVPITFTLRKEYL